MMARKRKQKDCGCGNGSKKCISKQSLVRFVDDELKKLDCGCGCKGVKGFCKKYGIVLRGGAILADCPEGWRNDGLTCVEPCKADEYDDGLTCRGKCVGDEINDGLTCRNPIKSSMNECPPGSRDVAGTCWGPVRRDCIDDCFNHPAPGCRTYDCGRLRWAGVDWGTHWCTDCNLRCGQTCWDVQGITKQLHERELRVWGGEVRGQPIRGKQIRGRVNFGELGKAIEGGLKEAFSGDGPLAKLFDPEKNGVGAAMRKFGNDMGKVFEEVGNQLKAGFEKMGEDAKRAFEQLGKDLEKGIGAVLGEKFINMLKDPYFWVEVVGILGQIAAAAVSAAVVVGTLGAGSAIAVGLMAASQMIGPAAKMIADAATGKPISALDIANLALAGASAAVPGLSGVTKTIVSGSLQAAKFAVAATEVAETFGYVNTCVGNCPPPPPPFEPVTPDPPNPPPPIPPVDPLPTGQKTDAEITEIGKKLNPNMFRGKIDGPNNTRIPNPDYISQGNWIAFYRSKMYGTEYSGPSGMWPISEEDAAINNITNTNATPDPIVIPPANEIIDEPSTTDFNFDEPPTGDFNFDEPPTGDFNFDEPSTSEFDFEKVPTGEFDFEKVPTGEFDFEEPPSADFNFEEPPSADFNFEEPNIDEPSTSNFMTANKSATQAAEKAKASQQFTNEPNFEKPPPESDFNFDEPNVDEPSTSGFMSLSRAAMKAAERAKDSQQSTDESSTNRFMSKCRAAMQIAGDDLEGGNAPEDLEVINLLQQGDSYINPGSTSSQLKANAIIPKTHLNNEFNVDCYIRKNPELALATEEDIRKDPTLMAKGLEVAKREVLTTHWIEKGAKEGLDAECSGTKSTTEERLSFMQQNAYLESIKGLKKIVCDSTNRFWIESESKCDGLRNKDGSSNTYAEACKENNGYWDSEGKVSFCNPFFNSEKQLKTKKERCNFIGSFWDENQPGNECNPARKINGKAKRYADFCIGMNNYWIPNKNAFEGGDCDVERDNDGKPKSEEQMCNDNANYYGRRFWIENASYGEGGAKIDVTEQMREMVRMANKNETEDENELIIPSFPVDWFVRTKLNGVDPSPGSRKILEVRCQGNKYASALNGEYFPLVKLQYGTEKDCNQDYFPNGLVKSRDFIKNVVDVNLGEDQMKQFGVAGDVGRLPYNYSTMKRYLTNRGEIRAQLLNDAWQNHREDDIEPPRQGTGKSKKSITLYYADWCPHCHNMMPEWNKLGKNHKGIKVEKFEENETDFQVDGFPTIIFRDGKKVEKYEGDRSKKAIVSYLKNKLS